MLSGLTVEDIELASVRLNGAIYHTPIQLNINLSEKYGCNIYLKREDLQVVRSYKIRGAYNFLKSQTPESLSKGIVCASAGNHAQGVALSCNKLKIKGKIFMPITTPKQKIEQVKMFGKDCIELILMGDTFDDAYREAVQFCENNDMLFLHPFNDFKVMAGQGTVGLEILRDITVPIDYLFLPIGGGGLAAGVSTYFKGKSPYTKIIGVEPAGAPSMKKAIEAGKVITLETIDKFIDGAAVKSVGTNTLEICKNNLDDVVLVPEGKACTTILKLYNEEAIVVEPAGALSIAALDFYSEQIKGKNIVCIVSGSNNDIARMQEIIERSLIYEGFKHYFIINFPQRAGALKEFVNDVLGPTDDITRFEYVKKTNREAGPAIVGIELKKSHDYQSLVERMNSKGFQNIHVNDDPTLFNYVI
ncbi:MAG: threonine ammonia-lyase IlvA [Opitutaceae bacterium]|nr:threonine ammonia-lyase IlvA [Cytophagales bacterium]